MEPFYEVSDGDKLMTQIAVEVYRAARFATMLIAINLAMTTAILIALVMR